MRVDGRTLSHEALETIRIMALRRVRNGEKPSEVIKSFGFCRTTIYKWLRAARHGGERRLKSRKGTGRPPLLSGREKHQVRSWICGKDPRQWGFDFGLWTRKIVAQMIEEKFGVALGITTVGRLLAELDITPQKPLRRAYERDPVAVKRWQEVEYPRIRARAKRLGANVFFLDEAGVRSDDPPGRTWGAKGNTPVVKTTGQRQSVNAISAVSASGAFWYSLYSGRLNATRFVEFLKDFMRSRRKKVFLVVDGHPAHRAKMVQEYVRTQRGRLELYFLPPYAPDLNPDEFVWKQVKKHGLAKQPLKRNESLHKRVEADLAAIASQPRLVRSFFHADSVAYILDLVADGANTISSKPPSSDIVKPPRTCPGGKAGRKRVIGGQPGHPKRERQPFAPDEIDEVFEYSVSDCPDCGGALKEAPGKGRVLQQVELVERPLRISEHRALSTWCPRCRAHVEAEFPLELERGGLFGPRLSAFVAYLRGGCHASYTTVQTFLGDVLGVEVSTGFLAKVVDKASEALAFPYDELRRALPAEPWLNVDETGHKDCGKRHWTWCFRAEDYSLFLIDPSRGSKVLREVLGETFSGVLGSDYFSAYRKYLGEGDVRVQFCLAHRSQENAGAYFEFMSNPGVEPTNNLAEQAIRFVVIDRKVTQGTRGERGRRWCERAWTMMATCAQQGRSAFDFLSEAILADFKGKPPPSLLST